MKIFLFFIFLFFSFFSYSQAEIKQPGKINSLKCSVGALDGYFELLEYLEKNPKYKGVVYLACDTSSGQYSWTWQSSKNIEKAFSLRKLSAVVLIINSPGGSPAQSSLIAARIKRLAKKNKIDVLAFCEDVAASGGYWLACAADEIYADENTIIGSIGVISSGFGFHELIERQGIERRVYTSGEDKSI